MSAADRTPAAVLRAASDTAKSWTNPQQPAAGPDIFLSPDSETWIGRGVSGARLPPNWVQISTKHCKIYREGDKKWFLVDGSTNGTYLNAQRVKKNVPVKLSNGDRIMLARSTQSSPNALVEYVFEMVEAAPAPASNNAPPANPTSPEAAAAGSQGSGGKRERAHEVLDNVDTNGAVTPGRKKQRQEGASRSGAAEIGVAAQLERTNQQLRAQLLEEQGRAQELTVRLAAAEAARKADREEAAGRVREAEAQRDVARGAEADARRAAAEAETERDQRAEEGQALAKRVRELEQELQEARVSAAAKVDGLRAEVAETTRALEASRQEAKAARQDATALKQAAEAREAELRRLTADLEEMRREREGSEQRLRESELRYRALQMQLSVASVGQQSAVDRLALQRARLEEILGSYERAAEARRQAEDAERRARGLLTDALQEVVRFSVPEAEAGEEKDEDGGRDDEREREEGPSQEGPGQQTAWAPTFGSPSFFAATQVEADEAALVAGALHAAAPATHSPDREAAPAAEVGDDDRLDDAPGEGDDREREHDDAVNNDHGSGDRDGSGHDPQGDDAEMGAGDEDAAQQAALPGGAKPVGDKQHGGNTKEHDAGAGADAGARRQSRGEDPASLISSGPVADGQGVPSSGASPHAGAQADGGNGEEILDMFDAKGAGRSDNGDEGCELGSAEPSRAPGNPALDFGRHRESEANEECMAADQGGEGLE